MSPTSLIDTSLSDGASLDAKAPPDPTYLQVAIAAHEEQSLARTQARRLEIARHLQVLVARRLPEVDLAYPLPAELRQRYDVLTAQLRAEQDQGATVHRRPPRWIRSVPVVVAVLDGLLLYTFWAEVFNVPLNDPRSVNAGVAAMLSLLGSAVGFVWFTLAGLQWRGFRTPLGELRWRLLGWSTRSLIGGSVVLAVTLAALMYQRVVQHVAQDGQIAPRAAAVLAWGFAVLSLAANVAVVLVHALDGSDLAARVRECGRALARAENHQERLHRSHRRRLLRLQPGAESECPDRGCCSTTD